MKTSYWALAVIAATISLTNAVSIQNVESSSLDAATYLAEVNAEQ